MSFDPHFALDTILPLAEAAYDLSKLPSGWTLSAPIQPDNFGFIAYSTEAVAVSIRGTEIHPEEPNPDREWIEDFDGFAVPNQLGKGMVHQGFQNQYLKIRGSIIAELRKLNLELPVWITGHSLGAALAVLCQADLAPAFKTLAYTWAGPRVGWADFATWFGSLKIECYRVVNEWDIVPHAPPEVNGFRDVGEKILIDGGRPRLDKQFFGTAHSLELSYRPGVAKLIAPVPRAA